MALGSTQPQTEMSTMNLRRGKGRPARKADNLTAISEPIVYKMWEPRRYITLWTSTACHKDSFTFFFPFYLEYLILKNPKIFYPSSTHVCAPSLFLLHIFWLSPAELAWSQGIN
jgi:hypothetical protein